MKRVGNIFDKMCTIENIEKAYLNAKKGKSGSYGVKEFEKNKDENIIKLLIDLQSLKFKTSKYTTFIINEYGKDRLIYRLPFYPDRIVHHLLMLYLEDIWKNILIRNTYACIKKRGIHDGERRLRNDLKNIDETKFCLKIDIKKFYPSINHEILKSIVRKKIKDKKILILLDEIIDSADGVPIGNYLSQYFANIYLTYFDHYMKEILKVKYYHRYADDIVVLDNDKVHLRNILNEMKIYFENELKLEIKKNYQIFPVEDRGIDYLGYKFYHTHVLLRKSIKKRMFRAIRKFTIKNYKEKFAAYNGWLKHCDSNNLKNKIYSMTEKRFSELGITVENLPFSGKKMNIMDVINREIKVIGFKIDKSKFGDDKVCLTIEFEVDNEKRILFSGSKTLKSQITQVNEEDFPFLCKISKKNNTFLLT